MRRLYFISSSLSDIDAVVRQLYQRNITPPQVHVLTKDDAELARYPILQDVEAVLRTDVVRGTEKGAMFGAILAVFVLAVSYFAGWTEVSWVPFIFLSIVCLGFCTWEGGFLGIQIRNHRFNKFNRDLNAGKHVLLVDVPKAECDKVIEVMHNSRLEQGGVGEGVPGWVVEARNRYNHFVEVMP